MPRMAGVVRAHETRVPVRVGLGHYHVSPCYRSARRRDHPTIESTQCVYRTATAKRKTRELDDRGIAIGL